MNDKIWIIITLLNLILFMLYNIYLDKQLNKQGEKENDKRNGEKD